MYAHDRHRTNLGNYSGIVVVIVPPPPGTGGSGGRDNWEGICVQGEEIGVGMEN